MLKFISLLIIILLTIEGLAQSEFSYKIMFYNVENLFDTSDDSLKKDDDFLPEGKYYWNKWKYRNKLNQIYKVVLAIGEWNPPAVVGLCEIENRKVLHDLTKNTPLKKFKYKIIHKDSPDERGIDVGLLYRSELFKPLNVEYIPINFSNEPENKTRDILYVKALALKDTLHLFVNHWPSRWGGQLETESRRIYVASVLRAKIDSIFTVNTCANIIVTGDFNDYPDNKSVNTILNANQVFDNIKYDALYNLSACLRKRNVGTYKHQGKWGVLDQFIVSGSLLDENNLIFTSLNDVHIFDAEFLLEPDEKYFGVKPFRTFIGARYNKGFSDHLPIYLILK
ncbi:MAG: hypothetical protein MI739_05010 [Bacteroidales bacterium]|nr:hypothetical protein [Bacteroidales bacterium]